MGHEEMRGAFLALQAAAQAKVHDGGSPVFANIGAHFGACIRVLDGLDEKERTP